MLGYTKEPKSTFEKTKCLVKMHCTLNFTEDSKVTSNETLG